MTAMAPAWARCRRTAIRSDDRDRARAQRDRSARSLLARALPAAQGDRPGAVGLGRRDLPRLSAALQVRARPAHPDRADAEPALRDRRAPGARALPLHPGETLAQLLELLEQAGAAAASARTRARARAARQGARRADALPRAAARPGLRAGVVRAPVLLPARAPPPARARRPRRPPRRVARATEYELIDYKTSRPKSAEQLEGRHPAVALRARRARVLGAGGLAAGLLLRARRPQGARAAGRPRRGARSRRSCSPPARASSPSASSRRRRTRPARSATTGSSAPRRSGSLAPPAGHAACRLPPAACRLPPAACDAVTYFPSGPRWRRKRWNSRASMSPEGTSSGISSDSSLSAACSRRSTNAWMSGSLCTARPTWRS